VAVAVNLLAATIVTRIIDLSIAHRIKRGAVQV
jgi:hypothetical protein